jgi:hypothetical protein
MWSPTTWYRASARRDPVVDEEEKRPTVRGGARVQKLRVERKGQGVLPSTSGHWIRGGCDSDAATATTAGVGAMPSWEVEGLGFWEEVLNGEGRDSGEKQLGREAKGWQGQAGTEARVAGNTRPWRELWDGERVWGERGTHSMGVCCVTGKAGQKKGCNARHGLAGARGVVDALLTFLIGVEI